MRSEDFIFNKNFMKNFLIAIFSIFFGLSLIVPAFAQDNTPEQDELVITSVKEDIQQNTDGTYNTIINIYFNKPVDRDSVRVLVENLKTREDIKINEIKQLEGKQANVWLIPVKNLDPNTPYKVTVSTATATTWETIRAGVNAIAEFTSRDITDEDVAKGVLIRPAATRESPVLNAPENTGASITGSAVTTATQATIEAPKSTEGAPLNNESLKKLPQTGPTFFVAICAAILASAFVIIPQQLKKKQK